jgi:hypothetical protein
MLEEIDYIASRQPGAAKARHEIGAVEATALGRGGGRWSKTKNVTIIGPSHVVKCAAVVFSILYSRIKSEGLFPMQNAMNPAKNRAIYALAKCESRDQ